MRRAFACLSRVGRGRIEPNEVSVAAGEGGEARAEAVPVVDVDHVAVAAVVAGLDVDHCARRGRRYRLTERGTEVDPGVQRRRAEEGIDARAETAGDRRIGYRRRDRDVE